LTFVHSGKTASRIRGHDVWLRQAQGDGEGGKDPGDDVDDTTGASQANRFGHDSRVLGPPIAGEDEMIIRAYLCSWQSGINDE